MTNKWNTGNIGFGQENQSLKWMMILMMIFLLFQNLFKKLSYRLFQIWSKCQKIKSTKSRKCRAIVSKKQKVATIKLKLLMRKPRSWGEGESFNRDWLKNNNYSNNRNNSKKRRKRTKKKRRKKKSRRKKWLNRNNLRNKKNKNSQKKSNYWNQYLLVGTNAILWI